MAKFVLTGSAFEAVQRPDEPVLVVPTLKILPITRDPNIEGFSESGFIEDRMTDILRAICENKPLPPVQVHELMSGSYRYKIYDGFHRYYASIAAGFSDLPITIKPDSTAFFDAEEKWRVRSKL